jgi:hypothetical protein
VIGDSGEAQRLIKTLPRKGIRFVGVVREGQRSVGVPDTAASLKPTLTLPDKPSIAILAFANVSGDPEQEYFADGITDDIITELSRFSELFVIARTRASNTSASPLTSARSGANLACVTFWKVAFAGLVTAFVSPLSSSMP